MENILDAVSAEAMIQRVRVARGIKARAGAFFSAHNPLAFRSRMADRVKNIRTRLDAIAEEKSKFGLQEGASEDTGVFGVLESRLTSSLVNEPEIEGRDEEKEMIINQICDENLVTHGDEVSVYAIWGMGGIGKTTLSQLVYSDQRVTNHFKLKIWVCVSDDFDVFRLTRAILESIQGNPSPIQQLDPLQRSLQEKLLGNRFLLVLDDIWNQDCTKWDGLKEGLKCGASGSIVMVTTRIATIAHMMAKHPEFIHHIGCLPKDESWSIFKRLAFKAGRTGGNVEELEPIGERIIEKCQGLPLALKALGSLMWSKDNVSEWSSVLGSDIWDLPQDEVSILPALKLSYDNLPHHFKQCFAYCCVFPKDYEMSKKLMIQLWIANKFIPSSGEADLYVVGEGIFNKLVWRSFFQDVKEDKKKGVVRVTCKMHDLTHDLAQSVIGHECSIIEPDKELKFPAEVLHVSSLRGLPTNEDLAKVRSLRSFFMLYNEKDREDGVSFSDCDEDENLTIPSQIFKQRYLRVLDLRKIETKKLPKSICFLKHLQYLNLSQSDIEVLPESIVYLQNLQILNLNGCWYLLKLPKGMRHMKNLQFLEIKGCGKLEKMPSRMGQLVGLRRLSKFIVGKIEDGNGAGELGELNLLEGELEIERLENVSGLEGAKGAKLKCKQNLTSLTLKWSHGKPCENGEEVVEGLEPHLNIKKLEIIQYMGLKIASWIPNLINLVEVKLYRCCKLEILPQLGKLPNLGFLNISSMDALKSFHEDDNTCMEIFSSLSHLSIMSCPKLIRLPDGLQNLRALESIWIRDCKHLAAT